MLPNVFQETNFLEKCKVTDTLKLTVESTGNPCEKELTACDLCHVRS